MYGKFSITVKYIRYYLTASNGKGHGIHSPFIFDFIQNVLNDEREFYAFIPIENLRQKLLKDNAVLEVQDLGAGSVIGKTNQRSIAKIASHTLKSRKFGRLLFRIVNYFSPSTIIELGTSLGVSTAYLASGNGAAKVYTVEGANSIADQAEKNFIGLNLYNTQLKRGNFDEILPGILNEVKIVDLAFIDGNHRLEPTLRYFEQLINKVDENSILIFDDIHWSMEMESAWDQIKKDPRVMATIDLFFVGLVFFRKDFKARQHFVIRF